MGTKMVLMSPFFIVLSIVGFVFLSAPGAQAWSKEGHMMTCRIAQSLLDPAASEVVRHLLPEYANGDLSSLCTWPDQIRHWYKYRWSAPLHFIDTPDNACSFDFSRDCHDPHGVENMCVAGAVQNYTSQLAHYKDGSSDRRYNMTEALLFLSHFMGDVHQGYDEYPFNGGGRERKAFCNPIFSLLSGEGNLHYSVDPMHVGFTSDEGGNTIALRWFRHKSNLHHVWDREIILTAEKELYDNDMDKFQEDIQNNVTHGAWSDDLSSWTACDDISTCPTKWAVESINLACKWGYGGVKAGETLSDEYFNSRFPIVTKRIAQGGVRLSMILNRVFGHLPNHHYRQEEILATT